MTPQRIIIVGGGGHARVLAAVLKLNGTDIVGFVDPDPDRADFHGLRRLGGDEVLREYPTDCIALVNGIGSTSDTSLRRDLFERFKNAGYQFLQVIHPAAIVAADAELGEGVQVMAGAIVQTGCQIGADALINTGAIVDHDCVVGAHVHIASGATIAGGVRIGECTHIGCGSVVIQGIRVGIAALIGAGAAVTAEVAAGSRVAGVPAKPIKRET